MNWNQPLRVLGPSDTRGERRPHFQNKDLETLSASLIAVDLPACSGTRLLVDPVA